MVNKSVLRKLSNQELEGYLKESNRFVPEAVQIAFEILEERGRIFSEQEKIAVQQLIQHKGRRGSKTYRRGRSLERPYHRRSGGC